MRKKRQRSIVYAFGVAMVGLLACAACVSHAEERSRNAAAAYHRNEAILAATLESLFARYREYRRPGKETTEVHVYDFDHTLADTQTLIPVRTASGALRQMDSKCFDVQKGERPDFEVFTEQELRRTAPIQVTLERLMKLKERPEAFVFVVTARSQEHTFLSALRFLKSRGARVDGVLALNSDFVSDHLWKKMGKGNLSSRLKKAFLIGGLVDLARRSGATIKLVSYHEDTDKYIRGFLELLPGLLPATRVEAFDYTRRKGPSGLVYTERLVAYAERGRLLSPEGSPFAGLSNYNSGDCPLR